MGRRLCGSARWVAEAKGAGRVRRLEPFPNQIGWRLSGAIRGGLAHYFLGHTDPLACTVCSAASFHEPGLLFHERMALRRCKTCDRSARRRGMR